MRAIAPFTRRTSAFKSSIHLACYPGRLHNRAGAPLLARNGVCEPRSVLALGPFRKPSQWPFQRFYSSHVREDDTIFALSTPAGTSAIAVVRASGPACVEIYRALCPGRKLPKPRFAAVRTLYDPSAPPSADSILDPGALVLHFPAPNTVTGEDILEFHIHGGPATIKAVLAAIPRAGASLSSEAQSSTSTSRIRYAQPGEFTRRAFQNSRLSLPQIEALSATLSAQTEQQRRLAARGSRSSLGAVYEAWRTQLLHARGELEALIDFSEDQHFDESPRELASNVARMVGQLSERLRLHHENAVRGELMRSGIQVALLGAPNAGKSSLLNRIVGREAAIVSQEAGTTRDVVEVGVDLGGWFVRFGDMAGLRSGGGGDKDGAGAVGEVEREGIRRAKERALQSDVVVLVFPVEGGADGTEPKLVIDPEVVQTAYQCISERRSIIVAINKIDKLAAHENASSLLSQWRKSIQELLFVDADRIFGISCKASGVPESTSSNRIVLDQNNLQKLLRGLTDTFTSLTTPLVPSGDSSSDLEASDGLPQDMTVWQDSLGASERQRLLLEECMGHLETFLAQATGGSGVGPRDVPESIEAEDELDIVVAAESLRAAADCLARITGRGESGDVEEVLGVVFEKFCVGK